DWFIQKAIAWWLRDLSKHDAPRTRDWLASHGERLKPFARKEAARHLS
ncbi:MAG: DNA alkylation repair protein, partial [Albidovulum sp.]